MKYVFIDIDGTLHSHRLKMIPDSAKEAMVKLKENGHKVFICTGRSLATSLKFQSMDVDGYVFSAGAVVYAEKKRIYSQAFNESQVQEIINLANRYELGFFMEGDAGGYQNEVARNHNAHYFEKRHEGTDLEQAFFEERMYPVEYRDPRDSIYKICIYGEDKAVFDQFEKAIPEGYHGIIMNGEMESSRIGMELTLRGIDKSTGAQHICEYYGCGMEDVVAIGDSLNDYEIVRDSGIGISMGNGHPELKKIADYVTDDVAEDGLANAFKHFGLI